MKKLILSLIIGAVAFTSCELDQEPYGYLNSEDAWENYQDMTCQYNGLLSYLRSNCGGSQMYLSDLMADHFNARYGSTSYQSEHNWSFTGTQFSGDAVWGNSYGLMLQANNLILHMKPRLEQYQGVMSADSLQELEHYYGTAYFARAFGYMNMLMRYVKDYEPETAKENLGLAIVEVVDEEYRPCRETLDSTCRYVEQQLDSALKYMHTDRNYKENGDVVNPHGEPTFYAALALKARLYLFTHQYEKAIEVCEELLNSGQYGLVNDKQNFDNVWGFDCQLIPGPNPEVIYMPTQSPSEKTNTYGIFISYQMRIVNLDQEYYGQAPQFIPTQGLIDLYEDGDLRKAAWLSDHNVLEDYMSGYPFPGAFGMLIAPDDTTEPGVCFTKFHGNYFLITSSIIEAPCNMAKPFRTAELFLIAAEASHMLGDDASALEYLNELRTARHASELYSSGDELFQDIKDEWSREYVGEGFRLYNLKRWHEGFTRLPAQEFTTEMLTSAPGYQELTIKADDPRLVWEIPQQDLNSNPNMQRNW